MRDYIQAFNAARQTRDNTFDTLAAGFESAYQTAWENVVTNTSFMSVSPWHHHLADVAVAEGDRQTAEAPERLIYTTAANQAERTYADTVAAAMLRN